MSKKRRGDYELTIRCDDPMQLLAVSTIARMECGLGGDANPKGLVWFLVGIESQLRDPHGTILGSSQEEWTYSNEWGSVASLCRDIADLLDCKFS